MSRLIDAARRAQSLIVVALAWEIVGQLGLVRPIFLPPLSRVIAQLVPLARDGAILEPLAASLFRAFAGLALALALGTLVGIAMTRRRWVRWLCDPLVAIGFPAPKIAFVPVFILWFGIDDLSKALLVAFSCVFPVILSAQHGAASVNAKLIWSAQAMGASERRILWRVIVPAALPHLFTGFKLALSYALIGVIAGEFILSGTGLGYAISFAYQSFDNRTMYGAMLFVLLVAVTANGVLYVWEGRLARRRSRG